MAAKKTTVQGKATVTKTNDKQGTQEQAEEQVGEPVMMPEDQVCHVGHKLGYTKNLGNYESLRIDVTITMPGYPHELQDISEFEVEWAKDRMEAIVDKVESELSE